MLKRNIYLHFLAILLIVFTPSCKKYLNEKSSSNLSTPETIKDLQLMLDNPTLVEGLMMNNTSSDEIYLDLSVWQAFVEPYTTGYIWDPNTQDEDDWNNMYKTIYYVNNVLHNLERPQLKGTQLERDQIRGAALFIRAHAFYQVAQLYAPQFNEASADTDMGIPLRLNADLEEVSVRSSIRDTYNQIVKDLKVSADLLPSNSIKTRPNKAAAYGLLARVFLQMRDYLQAKAAADSYLSIMSELINYNTVNSNPRYPFGNFSTNKEIAYYYASQTGLSSAEGIAKIDTILYRSYQTNDLRKNLFFLNNGDGSFSFRGKYTGSSALFTGIATDEIYLIRAEASARLGNLIPALNDLNTLGSNRYNGTFVPFSGSTADQVLAVILEERKKELVTRGLRWSDLRRLNKESQYAVTIRRKLGSSIYELPPNDLRYVFLIPQRILNRVNLPQNPR